MALGGVLRIPSFQRGLKWESSDVLEFLDSLYKGYPVGSLLFREADAPAGSLSFGPLSIPAPEISRALWVVDGQQRLTTLAAALGRPLPIPRTPVDPWVVYFDAKSRQFRQPDRSGEIPSTWVPAPHLLDASALSEWVFAWEHRENESLRAAVFDAGRKIREYKIPQYIVATDNEDVLREIFYRTNNTGKRLEWDEVHAALFGQKSESPSTLEELADTLAIMGMGRPKENDQLLPSMLAVQNLDVTRSFDEHYRRAPDRLRFAVLEAAGPIRGALSFLSRDAKIPHLRLLPRSSPLVVLSRFFAVHSQPNARTRTLLTRFVWRSLLGARILEDRTFRRQGVAAILEADEEQSIQNLLQLVSSEKPPPFHAPGQFDARAASSRIAMLGLASLEPIALESGKPLTISELIERSDPHPFRKIVDSGDAHLSAANRIILGGSGLAQAELMTWLENGPGAELLESHALSPEAAAALLSGKHDEFVRAREVAIEASVDALGDELAGWNQNDRPSIEYLLHESQEPGEPLV
jgi:hypothetical protein